MDTRTNVAVREAVATGLANAAQSPIVNLQQEDVRDVSRAVNNELGPVIANLTNNEPWYQSRVTWGALIAGVAGVLGAFGVAFPEEMQSQVLNAVVAAAPLVGAALALYGRWKARKPIGS